MQKVLNVFFKECPYLEFKCSSFFRPAGEVDLKKISCEKFFLSSQKSMPLFVPMAGCPSVSM